jgi:hypothetical protein
MATFGNFTGYEQLYGQPQADAMRQLWIGSNPELAYNTGVIDAARYKEITGKNAPDVVSSGGGGGGGGNLGEMWWHLPEAHVHSGGTSGGGWQPR